MDLELFAIIGCLLALIAFVSWEAWRRRVWSRPMNRALFARGFVPGASQREIVLLVLSAAMGVLGLALLFGGISVPPFSGRTAWVANVLYQAFGPHGVPIAVLIISLATFLLGLSARRRRLRET